MMMETERLSFIIRNQPLLRAENYKKLDDAIRMGRIDIDDAAVNLGKRLVLPSSFNCWRSKIQGAKLPRYDGNL